MKKIFTLLVALLIAGFTFAQPYSVTFNVNMQPAIDSGLFDPAGTDNVFISGSPWGWPEPGSNLDLMLTDDDSDIIYTFTCDTVPEGEMQFKFFLVEEGNTNWNRGEWPGDPNRMYTVEADVTLDYDWGIQGQAAVNELSKTNVNVYPNPAVDMLEIESNNGVAELYDINGRMVVEKELSKSNIINVSALSTGVYMLKVENNEGTSVQKVIVK